MIIPNYGIYTATIGVLFIIIVPLIIFMGKKVFNENKTGGWTPFLLGGVLLFLGIKFIIEGILIYANTIILIAEGTEAAFIAALEYALLHGTFPYPIGCFVLYFTSFIFIFLAAYFIKERFFSKNFDTEEKIEKIKSERIHFLDLEISRKLFHICIIAVLVGYLMLGELVGMGVYNATSQLYGHLESLSFIPYDGIDFTNLLNNQNFTFILDRWLVVFIAADISLLLIFSEFLRFFNFRYYPIKTIGGVYREQEKNAMGPHIYLVVGIMFVAVVFPPPIAMAAIAISGLADAVATIVGVTIGKKKVHKGSSKTWAGCIGGFISAFIFSLFSYTILINRYNIPSLLSTYYPGINQFSILQGIIASLVGATVFFLVDYSSPPMHFSDNILNPILCGLSMYLVCFIV
ncbi:MAG: hypothetical protein GF329_02150 [Candidatus Lokiarchaeota archaeon]|nr:hypothetical protein [Candidatus Lokiarchaeota archaeon]